jgi:hypothetical protein
MTQSILEPVARAAPGASPAGQAGGNEAVNSCDTWPPRATPDPADATDRGPGDAWARHVEALAALFLPLVVRDDRHGGHTFDGRKYGRTTIDGPLDRDALAEHFRAADCRDLCGVHLTAPDETGVLAVVDVDAHPGKPSDPDANLAVARAAYDEARGLGLAAWLLDSNGKGGYHVWALLGRPTPMAECFRLGRYLVRDHAGHGLADRPETFPKNDRLTGKRVGHWVRLPGRHHRRAGFYTRVWDDQAGDWAEGERAVRLLLATEVVPVDVTAVLPSDFQPRPRRVSEAPPQAAWSPPSDAPYSYRRRLRLATDVGFEFLHRVDDYDFWFWIGCCYRELGEDGRAIWHLWSSHSSRKYSRAACDEKWAGMTPGTDGAGEVAPGSAGLGSLFRRAERERGYHLHRPRQRLEEFDAGLEPEDHEDVKMLEAEALDLRLLPAMDEAAALLAAEPEWQAVLCDHWGVSWAAAAALGVGLREDHAGPRDGFARNGRWAFTVPLSRGYDLSDLRLVGYVRLYPAEGWKARYGAGSDRDGVAVPLDAVGRTGPFYVGAGPADAARVAELSGCPVALAGPGAGLDGVVQLVGSWGENRPVVVVPCSAPGPAAWADATARRLAARVGRDVTVLATGSGGLATMVARHRAGEGRSYE